MQTRHLGPLNDLGPSRTAGVSPDLMASQELVPPLLVGVPDTK